jgi:hypothetical protein
MSKKLSGFLLVIILLLSAYSITIFLQPKDILSNSPIYTDDYAMHFSHCLSARYFLSSFGKCWGYDPFFLAGFPDGALVNADNKAWELLFFTFSPLSEGFAFKLYLILFLLLYPFFPYAAARNFNFSRATGLIASVLAMLLFHLSQAIDFVSWGMLSFVFMCYFSLYVFSLFNKLLESFNLRRYVVLVFLAPLLLLMHILSPVHLFIPILILYSLHFKQLTPSRHLLVILLVVIVLAVNSYWLIPIAQFFQDKTTRPDNYTFTLQNHSIFEPLTVYIKQQQSLLYRKIPLLNNTFIEVMLLLFGICGFYSWWKEKRFKLALPLAGGVVFTFFVAYYGSYTSLFPQLQPQRFTIPLNILLLIPASAGMLLVFRQLFRGRGVAASVFILALAFALVVDPVMRPLKIIYKFDLYRLSCEFPAPMGDLLRWLEDHTGRDGRILIEDSEYDTAHQFYGGHLPALFPEYLKREYLCGPRPMYPIKHSYASFTAGLLFEKKLEDYSFEELSSALETYNAKWIVCWLEQSKAFFNQYPDYLIKMADIDKFTIYEVKREPTFFLKGTGTIHADYNKLELRDLVAENGEVIIKYHWMKYLKADPPVTIARAPALNDPIGFIKIINPPEAVTVYNGY